VLGPVDATWVGDHARSRGRRRRRLIVDDQMIIPSTTIKRNLSTSDETVRQLDLAPPTKQLMLDFVTTDKMLTTPGCRVLSARLREVFSAVLIRLNDYNTNNEGNGSVFFVWFLTAVFQCGSCLGYLCPRMIFSHSSTCSGF